MLNVILSPFLFSRVCGRKRKGTPVKVCDRAYVTEDEEEESMSEHSYSPGILRSEYSHTDVYTDVTSCLFCIQSSNYGKCFCWDVISILLQWGVPPSIHFQTYGVLLWCASFTQSTLFQVIVSIQRAQKIASLHLEVPTTCLIPLSSGKQY